MLPSNAFQVFEGFIATCIKASGHNFKHSSSSQRFQIATALFRPNHFSLHHTTYLITIRSVGSRQSCSPPLPTQLRSAADKSEQHSFQSQHYCLTYDSQSCFIEALRRLYQSNTFPSCLADCSLTMTFVHANTKLVLYACNSIPASTADNQPSHSWHTETVKTSHATIQMVKAQAEIYQTVHDLQRSQ